MWFRSCMVIAGLTAIAMAVVFLRAEQARCAAGIMGIESRWVSSRASLWAIQARAARLRAPQQVHDRAMFLQADVVPPDQEEPAGREQIVNNAKGRPSAAKRATP